MGEKGANPISVNQPNPTMPNRNSSSSKVDGLPIGRVLWGIPILSKQMHIYFDLLDHKGSSDLPFQL